MPKTQTVDTDDSGLFDNVLSDDYDEENDNGNDDANVDDFFSPEAKGNGNGKKLTPEQLQIQKLQKDLSESQRQAGETQKALNEKIQELEKTAGVTKKIQGVFSDNDKEQKDKENELAERAEYDKDPFGYYQKKLAEARTQIQAEYEKKMDERINPISANMTYSEIKNEIDKKYDTSIWSDPKNEKKILTQLETLSIDYRRKEPKKALIRAAFMAGLLHKRPEAPNFVEGSVGAPVTSRPATDREAKSVIQGVLKAAKPNFFTK